MSPLYIASLIVYIKEFAIRDLGKLTYLLRLEVTYTDDCVLLSQTIYGHDILILVGLLDTKVLFVISKRKRLKFADHICNPLQ